MQITYLHIMNYKSISDLELKDIEDVLILVGRNSTGKSVVLDAIRVVSGDCSVSEDDFNDSEGNISIKVHLMIDDNDLKLLFERGVVSSFKHYNLWLKDFNSKLPSYNNNILEFEYIYTRDGKVKYKDGFKKNNTFIKAVLPKIYYVDHLRRKSTIQDDIVMLQGGSEYTDLKNNICIFDRHRHCNQCFNCIGMINKKKPSQLSLNETTRLLQFKLFNLNLANFEDRLNEKFKENGAKGEVIHYKVDFDADKLMSIETTVHNTNRNITSNIDHLSDGLNSIYILSLLETYAEYGNTVPYIILIEDPEIFLHPQLQKVASEILYKLSRKNQVLFSTHSPQMLFNFTTKQIKQVVSDENNNTVVLPKANIDHILNDLGYAANDLMNVSFVFIVEGKQDKSRLPILIRKYYAETYDQNGQLFRIAIINTNSCTNIKTYANLKYINQIYLKDQFLMIRDGDGKDRKELQHQLCRYYEERSREDMDALPRVRPQNVLVLRYYSFENYFLNPEIMVRVGVLKSEEQFYEILLKKWKEYLWKIKSGKHLTEIIGKNLETVEDIREHMEKIKIYLRGHNLFDIFYGRYKKNEKEILTKYIELASREEFADILDAIDSFIYFENRKK